MRADQIRELGLFVAEHDDDTGPSVLLGDFNAGPEANPEPITPECPSEPGQPALPCPDTCTPVDPTTLATLTGGGASGGWTDRAGDLGFNECKGPADALALLALFPCEGSQRIDHCLVRGLGNSAITALARVMDHVVAIPIPNNMIATTLSDHVAVQCTIGTPP